MSLSPHTTARLYLLAGAALWSTGGFFIKEIDAGATSITFFRCLFAGLLLAPAVAGRRFPRGPDIAVSIVLFALLLGLYVGATKETTAANAIFLQYTAPLYVIALAPWLLGERLRSRDALPFAICIAGIAVLFIGNRGSGDIGGMLLGAGSGFFYGLFLLWLRRVRYANPIAITFANCIGVAVLFSFALFNRDVDAKDLALLFVMGAVQFALPYLLFTRGLREVEASEASLIALIEPVLNPIWVALFYGEDPSTATIVGGAIIIAGLAFRYAVLRDRAAARTQEVETPHPGV
jgi:drug/metabolite transporter (DMT)-like permease